MNPPLRSEQDRLALIEGLRDGTIDVIATDHAPHAIHEKDDDFPSVPFGVIGLETAASVIMDRLVNEGHLSPMRFAEVMSLNPRIILDLPGGFIEKDALADITIMGEKRWEVDSDMFFSQSRNTPFDGWKITGKPLMTIVEGEIVHDEID
jgi:dihydroorotase